MTDTSDCYDQIHDLVGKHLDRDDTTTLDNLMSDYAEALARDVRNETRDAFCEDLAIIKEYLPDQSPEVKVVLAWLEDRLVYGNTRNP